MQTITPSKLPRTFYARPVLTVARELVGKTLVHITEAGVLRAVITETEAYDGTCDKGCHAYPYKCTDRTRILFGEAGHAYIYLIYGMYHCFNIVTNEKGYPAGVLIRAVVPVGDGLEQMAALRKQPLPCTEKQLLRLMNGPGKLCQGMSLTKAENGMDLCSEQLYVEDTPLPEGSGILTTPRINIDYAEEAKDFLWRFVLEEKHYKM